MSKNFGINGFGRIGRTSFRVWWQKQRDKLDLKVVNTSGSMEIEDWIHLLKYDSNYGLFTEKIEISRIQSKKHATDENPILGTIKIADQEITFTAQRNPEKIPWGQLGVETVIEATGVFRTEEQASLHLQGGAKNVLISAPAKGGNVSTAVIGVNEIDKSINIYSSASCTTNCVAPVVKIMLKNFGIKKAIMTTIHSYTDDQNTQDNSHKDLRRARTAAENIIPTTTGAALATSKIIPEVNGLFDGMAVRVPTPVGSLSDMVFITEKITNKEEVNKIFEAAAKSEEFKNIVAVTNDAIVSSDIIGRDESSIVDLSLTQVIAGDLVKVISWYDNEWGYCNRLIEQILVL
ncbi:MAG: type I glyceraldehyde-3-phosphate dehydrogenase [Candidatus Woesebacteria bacterium]|jgi:glyceraldehyde 3-phosphate dehydrogenase